LNSLLLWFLSKWRPKFEFARADIKDIFNFSANLTGFNIVNYFARNFDQLLIGKYLGVQALGYYAIAYKIMLWPLQNISWIIVKVMYPAFSKIQKDTEKVKSVYLIVTKAIAIIAFPVITCVFMLADKLVIFVFGEKWIPVINLVKVLSFCGLIQSIHTTCGSLILSQGRSDLQLKLGTLSAFFAAVAILIGLHWGLMGVVISYTIEQYLWICYAQWVANSLVNMSYAEFLLPLGKTFLGCSLIVASVWFIRFIHIGDIYPLIEIVVSGLIGTLLYIAFVLKTDGVFIRSVKERRFET
jgi:PST family polysaccharide transporter